MGGRGILGGGGIITFGGRKPLGGTISLGIFGMGIPGGNLGPFLGGFGGHGPGPLHLCPCPPKNTGTYWVLPPPKITKSYPP